jgi:hypothetical protein
MRAHDVSSLPRSPMAVTAIADVVGASLRCWGEGEHATLRSMSSSPLYTNEDHIHKARPSKPKASFG